MRKKNNRELLIEKYIPPTKVKRTKKEWLNKHGNAHSFNDQPAKVYYWKSGKIMSEYWYKNGVPHRDGNKPSAINYFKSGRVMTERWYKNGKKIKFKNFFKWKYDKIRFF